MNLKQKTQALFAEKFGYAADLCVQAPGRVNLIGEHTDYNDGFVLPCAIDYQTVISAAVRADRRIRVIAADYASQQDEFSLDEAITPHETWQWANYVRGVVKFLQQRDPRVGGADLVISGNVPQGAGLSSSASLEVVTGKTLQQLYQLDLDNVQIALNGQQAENQFVGCNCGIMDQLIAAQARAGSALLIDCRSLETKAVPLPVGLAVVIINSNFKRTLVGSEYNTRRRQCEEGARFFGQSALRDVSPEMFSAREKELDPLVAKRVRHVLTENARTLQAVAALSAGDVRYLGELMAQSHNSMRDDFEITVPQIDALVEIVRACIGGDGGVRMTGGGFGGCVVALIPQARVDAVRRAVAEQYQAKTGIKETFYVCTPSQGVSLC